MSNIVRLREQVAKCRRLARMSGDAEIERRLTALADEYEAKTVKAECLDKVRSRGPNG